MAFLRLQVNVRIISLNGLDFISSPLHLALRNHHPIFFEAEDPLHIIRDCLIIDKSAVTAFCFICNNTLIPGIV
jgi:hypothetical protein